MFVCSCFVYGTAVNIPWDVVARKALDIIEIQHVAVRDGEDDIWEFDYYVLISPKCTLHHDVCMASRTMLSIHLIAMMSNDY